MGTVVSHLRSRFKFPKRKFVFLSPLSYVNIYTGEKHSVKLTDELSITNSSKKITKLMPVWLENEIGRSAFQEHFNARALVYSTEYVATTTEAIKYLNAKLNVASTMLSFSWIVKDNSISLGNGFVIESYQEEDAPMSLFETSVGRCFSMSDGPQSDVIFKKSELERLGLPIGKSSQYLLKHSAVEKSNTNFSQSRPKFMVALLHVSAARLETDLGFKIALYCSALESLFSTNEVS